MESAVSLRLFEFSIPRPATPAESAVAAPPFPESAGPQDAAATAAPASPAR
jgi:hypothetical protein